MKYLLLFLSLVQGIALAQNRTIFFPNVPGYETVVVDLHMHTVFSDGSVWPDIRVYEALRDGIDLIAMTEHLEYQPHEEDIPHPNRNRAFELAYKIAEDEDLMVVNGAEITRDMPPGHSNSVFIEDANALLKEDPVDAFREAHRQGGFTFWNHPMWSAQNSDGVAKLTDLHRQLISEGLLHGIEVVNDITFSDEALQIALDNNLTILGTSDIHGLVDWQYKIPEGGHRPVTMVFASSREPSEVKDALLAGRTAVWFNNLMIGKKENVVPLIESSLEIKSASYNDDDFVLPVVIYNPTGVRYILENLSDFTFYSDSDIVEIAAKGETVLEVKTLKRLDEIIMKFRVLNALVAPKSHPEISMSIKSE